MISLYSLSSLLVVLRKRTLIIHFVSWLNIIINIMLFFYLVHRTLLSCIVLTIILWDLFMINTKRIILGRHIDKTYIILRYFSLSFFWAMWTKNFWVISIYSVFSRFGLYIVLIRKNININSNNSILICTKKFIFMNINVVYCIWVIIYSICKIFFSFWTIILMLMTWLNFTFFRLIC